MPRYPRQRPHDPVSTAQIRRLVRELLPAWVRACDADSDAIALHETAFGTTGEELFLFACAIKYAALRGKNVHIACGEGKSKTAPESIVSSVSVEVYRERDPLAGPIRTPKRGGKKTGLLR
jgi:hypothetical protein